MAKNGRPARRAGDYPDGASIQPLQKLKAERIQARLGAIPGWSGKDRRRAIARTYRFPSFRAALAFVAYVGELAEHFDHHPDIDLRYDKVTLVLTTHEAGGLTDRDFDLAEALGSG